MSARRNVLPEILEFWASSGIVLIHNGLRRIVTKVCNLRNCKKAPFDGKRTTLALPNDSFCQSIVVVLHGKRSRFRRLMQSFCYRKAVILGWKRGSGGVKSIKNDSENLQNRFLFCNSFLLSVLYLHWLESTGGTLESGSSESRNVTITLIKSNCRRLWRGRHMPEQAAM